MAEFMITVSETQEQYIPVTADSLEEAIAQVQESWNDGHIELSDYRNFNITGEAHPTENQ